MATANRRVSSASLAVVVPILGMLAHAYHFFTEAQIVRSTVALMPVFFVRVHLFLTLMFLFIALGLLLRTRIGALISLICLIAVFFAYCGWYMSSARVLKVVSEYPGNMPPHVLGLFRGRWWDPIILALCVPVFIWQSVRLIKHDGKR